MQPGPTIVQASLAAFVALGSAPVVGLAVLVLRMMGRSGHLGMSLKVLWRNKADTVALIAYDAVGGAVCVAGVLVLGITRPPALVEGFKTQPALAWAIVGAVGPMVSAGVLDRLPLRAMVDFIARSDERDGRSHRGSTLVEVRFQASQRILFALYEDVRVNEGIARDLQSVRARELVAAGQLRFDDVAREMSSFSKSWKRRLPPEVSSVMKRRESWPTGEDPGREVLVLIETLLDLGLTRPVSIACRIAEQRSAGTGVVLDFG